MASTYSTNLAIELIGTGDQAGAWGNTTNTNLGTLIEQAISGYVTQAVATGTDTTITIPNGATGVARNMYIELTGTGGSNTNLIVPSNKKLYFIYNNASGAVTVKVAGQTGVSVAVGQKKVLVSNGTDIVEATTYLQASGGSATLTTLTAASATITNLAVSSLTLSSLSLSTLTATSANITTLTGSSMNVTTATHASANITTLTGTSANITNISATSLTVTNTIAGSINGNAATVTNGVYTTGSYANPSWITSLAASKLSGTVAVGNGGTGLSSTPTNGQLLTGNGTGFTLSTLNGGPGVGITNSAGSITITATGTGFIASVNATSPLQSVGTESITISIASSTGSGAVVLASGAQFDATSANITTLTGTTATFTSGTVTNLNSTSANITTLTGASATITNILDGAGNVRDIPSAGSAKTSTYTLAITDIGEYVTISTGGSIDVPNGVFSAGNAVSIVNNTSGAATISLTITTAYLSGTDADKASVSLATRGIATILFLSNSVCIISGSVS